ncbi:MAG: hypothetical protein EOO39_03130, partial [Cytophagaceae bacterium]
MRDDILLNINNPRQLETLYWTNKSTFKADFNALYPQLQANPLAEGWYQRLNYTHEDLAANMWDGGSSYPNHGY